MTALTQTLRRGLDELGFVISSHVVCRMDSSVSGGRNEETLTGDIGDLFAQFPLAEEYVSSNSSGELLRVRVAEVNKIDERVIGADFVVLLFRSHVRQSTILKIGGVQAKRVRDSGAAYMRGDYLEHARALVKHFGEQNSWFAFYHNERSLGVLPTSRAFPTRPHMKAVYVSPVQSGTNCYFANHPVLGIECYVEPSAYISRVKRQRSAWLLPTKYEFGVTMFPATHWVRRTSAGRIFKRNGAKNIPPDIRNVLINGSSLSDWLISLAECNVGRNLADSGGIAEASEILRRWLAQNTPQFIVFMTMGDQDSIQVDPWMELIERRLSEQEVRLRFLGIAEE